MELDAIRARLQEDLNELRTPQGYLRAGAPRYSTLFGRDSLISAWQTLEFDPSIAAATLRVLASYQGKRVDWKSEEEPGKILHEHRFELAQQRELPDWGFPYYGSIDSTPLFLIVADAYVTRTGDGSIADELWIAIEAAHRWMSEFGDADGDGYLEYVRKNPHGLRHQGWKDGSEDHLQIAPPVAMIEVQGYAVAAHRAYARLARRRGQIDDAERAQDSAERVRRALDRDFWIPKSQFFALALDGSKRPRTAITSNPGHLLVVEAVAPERVDAIVERLFAEDMWTPYGLRTHASSEPDFDPYGYHMGSIWPHDNWFLYKGLRAQGRDPEALQVRDALLRAWEELGGMPELYAVVDGVLEDLSGEGSRALSNPLQAWSSAALLDMLSEDEPRLNL